MKIEDDIIKLADGKLLRKHLMIPFEYKEGNVNIIRVAMADPMDMRGIDDFSIITNLQVEPVIATTQDILVTLDKYYGDSEAQRVAEQYAKERESRKTKEEQAEDEDVANSPIVQLVKSMIEQAARQRASDIHIEPMEDKVRVRYRIDGVLYEKSTYHINLLSAIITRVKIIGNMDISEKRRPQDGRITMMIDRKEYDIRASILPTVYGEKCVMRLAQKKALTRDKKSLGFTEQQLQLFDDMLNHPNGIILVTGPTGSGKTTTLYAALGELAKPNVNVITVEDPVEKNIEGINQCQVNAKAGMTFAAALRSILRQDPDIVIVGEMRDQETAEIAIRAAITGHMVLSTLHTNDAASTITRLVDMGVAPYMVATSLIGIVAQRLCKVVCNECKTPRMSTPEENELLGITESATIYDACGCPKCNNTGYTGRTAIHEILLCTHEMASLIAADGKVDAISSLAKEQGCKLLRDNVAELVLEGRTTLDELVKLTFAV